MKAVKNTEATITVQNGPTSQFTINRPITIANGFIFQRDRSRTFVPPGGAVWGVAASSVRDTFPPSY
jgi:hypothetical protein